MPRAEQSIPPPRTSSILIGDTCADRSDRNRSCRLGKRKTPWRVNYDPNDNVQAADAALECEDGRSGLLVRRQRNVRARARLRRISVSRPGRCVKVADLDRVGFGYHRKNDYGVDRCQPRS